MKKYLVQTTYYDEDEDFSELMTEYKVVSFINMLDCYDHVKEYKVFDISEFGKIKPLHYTGWQRECLIELADDDGNIVISGYGEDH